MEFHRQSQMQGRVTASANSVRVELPSMFKAITKLQNIVELYGEGNPRHLDDAAAFTAWRGVLESFAECVKEVRGQTAKLLTARRLGLSESAQSELVLAVDEAAMNVLEHALLGVVEHREYGPRQGAREHILALKPSRDPMAVDIKIESHDERRSLIIRVAPVVNFDSTRFDEAWANAASCPEVDGLRGRGLYLIRRAFPEGEMNDNILTFRRQLVGA